jgi:hypothetical protein
MNIAEGEYENYLFDHNKVIASTPPKMVAKFLDFNRGSNFSDGCDLFDLSLIPPETMEKAKKIFEKKYKEYIDEPDTEDGE